MNLTTEDVSKVYELTKDIGLEKLTRIVLDFNNIKHLEQENKKTTILKDVLDHVTTYAVTVSEKENSKLDAIAMKVMLSSFENVEELF